MTTTSTVEALDTADEPGADSAENGQREGVRARCLHRAMPEQAELARLTTLVRRRLLDIVLVVAIALSLAAAGWSYRTHHLPDRDTNHAAAESAIHAAQDAAIAVLSYRPDTFYDDFAAARSQLTGEFLSYYDDFTVRVLTPAIEQGGVSTSATVLQAAVSQLSPEQAVVLLFVNQTVASTDVARPSLAPTSIKVTLTKVDGAWRVAQFEPI